MYAPFIDADFSPDLLDNLPEILDLTRAGLNLTVDPPSPAIADSHTGIAGNKWVNDNETFPVRDRVEIGDTPNVGAGLMATMQNHEQWHRRIVTVTMGKVQLEAPVSRARVPASAESPAGLRGARVCLLDVQRPAHTPDEVGKRTTNR